MSEKQPEKPSEKFPVAPPRNNVNRHGLLKTTQAARLQGENPDFIYKSFSTEPRHPSSISKKLSPHEVGTQLGGYALAPAWEPVQRVTDAATAFVQPRDDQGKGVDTVQRFGTQVVCRMRKADYDATYGKTEAAYQEEMERQFYTSEKVTFSEEKDGVKGTASVRAALSKDGNVDIRELLGRS